MDEKIPFCPDCNSRLDVIDGRYICPVDGELEEDLVAWVEAYMFASEDEDDDLDYCGCGMGLDADGLCPSCDKGGGSSFEW